MMHEAFIWAISIPLAVLAALLLVHKVEARRQRRNNWWRGK